MKSSSASSAAASSAAVLLGRGGLGGPAARQAAGQVGPAPRASSHPGGTVGADRLHAAAAQLELIGRQPAHDDGDVAGPLADARGLPTGPGTPALHGRALVGVAGRDVELLGTLLVVVGRVGHGRRQDLADGPMLALKAAEESAP